MKTTNSCSVRLITTPKSDLKIVNAARVSFAKEVSELSDGDEGLIRYLATHKHWTPFSHVRDTFNFGARGSSRTNDLVYLLTAELPQEVMTSAVMKTIDGQFYIRTSLFGWCSILNAIAKEDMDPVYRNIFTSDELCGIYDRLKAQTPVSIKYLLTEDALHLINDARDDFRQEDVYAEVFEEPELTHPEFIDYTMYEAVPIFVVRQRFKHMVGTAYNEVSRRYVSSVPVIFTPDMFRGIHANKKQGSTDVASAMMTPSKVAELTAVIARCVSLYNEMVDDKESGVCPEQARMILPQSMMTEYYVTSNKSAINRLLAQRLDSHAQLEIQDLAKLIKEIVDEVELNG